MKSPLASSTVQGQIELRVKVAELCGWIQVFSGKWFSPSDQKALDEHRWGDGIDGSSLPDYPSDLNACAEMEKELSAKQWNKYVVNLARVIAGAVSGDKVEVPTNVLISATAEQRCLAFVKTMEGK